MQLIADSLWDGWRGVAGILVTAPLLYLAIIAFVRLSGKRSTSQMNNFDWIVTVALGSLVASGILLVDVTLAEALLAVIVLMGLQYGLTALAVRSEAVDGLIKAEPRLLLKDGRLLREAMRRERVTEQEVLAALRENGLGAVKEAQWVILESDASFSVQPKEHGDGGTGALQSVSGV